MSFYQLIDIAMEPKKSAMHVVEIDVKLAPKLIQDLENQSFEISQPPYTLFMAKKNKLVVTLYKSGKLTVAGKDSPEFIEFYLEPEILGSFKLTHNSAYIDLTPRIGVDESGKGDFFGPLVIASVYGDETVIPKLKAIGVKDSKTLKEPAILEMAKKIKEIAHFEVIRIMPLKYNELYGKFGNLNSMLAWGHAQAISNLVQKTGCKKATIDQFASEHVVKNALLKKHQDIQLSQQHRGEQDIVIAAASILAREGFVTSLAGLEKTYEHKLPKGASAMTVSAAREFAKKLGKGRLREVAKIHFKTYNEIEEF